MPIGDTPWVDTLPAQTALVSVFFPPSVFHLSVALTGILPPIRPSVIHHSLGKPPHIA